VKGTSFLSNVSWNSIKACVGLVSITFFAMSHARLRAGKRCSYCLEKSAQRLKKAKMEWNIHLPYIAQKFGPTSQRGGFYKNLRNHGIKLVKMSI
jgi:hypothetical protein